MGLITILSLWTVTPIKLLEQLPWLKKESSFTNVPMWGTISILILECNLMTFYVFREESLKKWLSVINIEENHLENCKWLLWYWKCKCWSILTTFSRIVKCLIELGKSLGCYKITLNCTDQMITFYERLGFVCEKGNANFLCIRVTM